MKKSMQFSYYGKIVLNVVVYFLFFIYIIGFIIVGQIDNKVPWVIFCLVGFFIAGLYEILKYMFDKATKSLVFDGKPELADKLVNKVDKIDLLKTFRSSTAMMRILIDIDLRDFNKLKKDIEQMDKEKDKVKNDYDVILLKEYGNFIYECEKGNNSSKLKDAYRLLLKVRDIKTKKGKTRKGVYFFNWDFVEATYKFYDKNFQQAYNLLDQVNIDRMNNRELMHYYIIGGISAKRLGKEADAKEGFDLATEYAGNNKIMIDFINNNR